MHMFREPGDEDMPGESREPREGGSSTDSGNEMNPRSQPPKPSAIPSGITANRRIPSRQQPSVQSKVSNSGTCTTSLATAGHTARTINVKAVGRADFRSGGKATAGVGLPGASTVSSVLVERHSGPDTGHAKTIRSNQPSQNNPNKISSTKPKPVSSTVRTTHAPPVKVVH